MKLRSEPCTDGSSPQCAANTCQTDADCPNAGTSTCCYCNQTTKRCQNASTCSSCIAPCVRDGSSVQDCCCSQCPGQGITDCASSIECYGIVC